MADQSSPIGEGPSLRILIVSAFVPPLAPFGATRVPALARYLAGRGHEVRLLAADNRGYDPTVPSPLPEAQVAYVAPGIDVTPVPESQKSAAKRWIARSFPTLMEMLRRTRQVAHDLRTVPDAHSGWIRPAQNHAVHWCSQWKPDVIYSSGPPHSGHIVAAGLAARWGCLWVAELRDSWSSNPYMIANPLLRMANLRLERRTLREADMLVAVTAAEQHALAERYSQRVLLVRNGFSPEDLETKERPQPSPDQLVIVHAGALYGGKRDPRLLLEALRRLGGDARSIRLRLIGEAAEIEALLSSNEDVRAFVEPVSTMPRQAVLEEYASADVLLLLRWDDPRERNFIAGKLFEYIAARKPVLSIGCCEGEVAQIIEDNDFGVLLRDPDAIAAQLRQWLEIKRQRGLLPAVPLNRALPFNRNHQFKLLNEALINLVQGADAS